MDSECVAVIILNYNSSADTLKLVASIRKYEKNYGLIIVDNNSSLEEKEILKSEDLDAEMIFLDANLGYAAGNNVGLRRAVELEYQYYLIANSDTEIIHPDTIRTLLSAMKKLNADAAGPGMLNAAGKLDSGQIVDGRMGRTRRIFADQPVKSRSLTGAFLLLSRRMLLKNGYMPEEYFLYREETDYLVRANGNGLSVYYIPSVEIIHRHGLTTGKVWDYYFNRNTIYFARKIWKTSLPELALYHFLKTIYNMIRVLLGMEERRDKRLAVRLMWQGYADGLRGRMGKKENL